MASENESAPPKPKLVFVGDGCCGKTTLLRRRIEDKFVPPFCGTVFDNYDLTENVNRQTIELHAADTSGMQDFDRLRPFSYPEADVFCLCFDVANEYSFESIKSKWIPEVCSFCPDVPLLLVGCKIDLITNEAEIRQMKQEGLQFITEEQGHKMAAEIGAAKYVECSALTDQGVGHVFQTLTELAVKHFAETEPKKQNRKDKKCRLM